MDRNPSGRSRFIDSEDWTTLFLRGLAVILIALGLYQWATIMGVVTPSAGTHFSEMPGGQQGAIINLAVAYPVAATGLWMLTRWGVVIWLYAALWQIALHTLFVGTFGFRLVPVLIQVVALAAFAAIVFFRRHSERGDDWQEKEQRAAQSVPASRGSGRFGVGARERIVATLARRPLSAAVEPAKEPAPPVS